jgi:Uncharacterised nucleotidyltransferase
VSIGDTDVRILGPEDQLHYICLHFLRHGAWRPLWLCDIAAAVEARPENFDWHLCLGDDPLVADWVACAIGLAHQLLEARVDDTPVARRARNLPRWLVPAVLREWEAPYFERHVPTGTLMEALRHPASLPRALRVRWRNPVEATIRTRAPMNDLPRLPFQVYNVLQQASSFVKHLPEKLR